MGIKDINVNDYIIKPPDFTQASPRTKAQEPKHHPEAEALAPIRTNDHTEVTFPASYILKHFLPDFDATQHDADAFAELLEPDYRRPEGQRPSLKWTNTRNLEARSQRPPSPRRRSLEINPNAERNFKHPDQVVPAKRYHDEEPDIETLRRRRAALVAQCRAADDQVERNPRDTQLRYHRDSLVEQLRQEDEEAFRKRASEPPIQRQRHSIPYDQERYEPPRPNFPPNARSQAYYQAPRKEAQPRGHEQRKIARFFLIAATARLAELAKTEGTWALPVPQAEELSQAFQTNKVFMIFQGEQSDTLLGYAQIEGDIGAGLRPTWIKSDMPFMPINFMKLNAVTNEAVVEIVGGCISELDVMAELPAEEGSRLMTLIKTNGKSSAERISGSTFHQGHAHSHTYQHTSYSSQPRYN